jgi:lactate dehydrogenase-like 2-hydroxyacid dehydrogenase
MTKPTVLVTRKLPDAVEARAARDYDARLNPDDRTYDAETLLAKAAEADALLICPSEPMPAAMIARLPERVKIIACYTAGVDHVDLAAAKARGLPVTNAPDVLADATAEVSMLLMLAAARRAYEGERLIREDRWNTWATTFMLGTQLTGKRLGIVGMGKIGRGVAQRARGFGMEIHYHNRSRLPPELEAGATYHARLEDMLRIADFVSLNCPATPETRHLINAQSIALMPQGAIVVNAARGSVVDDAALIAALRSGRIAAAGLDVYEGEPKINPGYRELPNTFLLPHIGSATLETRNAMGFRALDNLDAWFRDGNPRDRVA